jgi:hypothetical protein
MNEPYHHQPSRDEGTPQITFAIAHVIVAIAQRQAWEQSVEV